MQRAQRRDACLSQKFWWRRDVGAPSSVAPQARDASEEYAEMTIEEIVNGKVLDQYRSQLAMSSYIDSVQNTSSELTFCKYFE